MIDSHKAIGSTIPKGRHGSATPSSHREEQCWRSSQRTGDQARGAARAGRRALLRHCRHPAARAKNSPRSLPRRSRRCEMPACFSSSCRRWWAVRKPIPSPRCCVLEEIAYHDFTSGWCTMVGATAVGSLGAFLPQAGLDRVFANGHIPTAAISFFPAGRAVREKGGYRVSGRWRFNSGIRHSEWVLGGTIVEGTENENGGKPLVIFAAFPTADVTLYDNWRDVVGLKGTGSCDCSVENYHLPEHLSFVWDLLEPKPLRGGPSYLFPPFSFVAKEHGSVAIGAARRALDELIKIATTTRGTFRSSKLDERQVVHRKIAEADLRIRAVRALMHERYEELYQKASAGAPLDGADIADVRAMAVYATDIAIDVATMALSLRRQHRPAPSPRARSPASRSEYRRSPPGDERHGLRKSRQVPIRYSGRPAGVARVFGIARHASHRSTSACRNPAPRRRIPRRNAKIRDDGQHHLLRERWLPLWDERHCRDLAVGRPARLARVRQQIDGDPPSLEPGRALLRQRFAELSSQLSQAFSGKLKGEEQVSRGRLARDRRRTAVSR